MEHFSMFFVVPRVAKMWSMWGWNIKNRFFYFGGLNYETVEITINFSLRISISAMCRKRRIRSWNNSVQWQLQYCTIYCRSDGPGVRHDRGSRPEWSLEENAHRQGADAVSLATSNDTQAEWDPRLAHWRIVHVAAPEYRDGWMFYRWVKWILPR